MRYLKRFNESMEGIDTSYSELFKHIKDLMQEIIDEYDLYEYTNDIFDGWYYHFSYYKQIKNKLRIEIFKQTTDITGKSVVRLDFESPCFTGFESRLKSLGYTIDKVFIDKDGRLTNIDNACWMYYEKPYRI